MKKYRIYINGELQDEVFDSYDAAEKYALYLVGCLGTGAETFNMSNPGDYPYDENSYEDIEYEIVEEED